MTDEPVRTEVRTDDGWLDFQDYFVRRHQAPDVREVRFRGIEAARPTRRRSRPPSRAAEAIVIAPSNPIVSIGPILAVPGLRRGDRRGPRAGRPGRRPSRGSSAARRSGARPTGCSPRSATSRPRSASPAGTRGLLDGFVLDRATRPSRRRSRRWACEVARHGHDHDRRRGRARLAARCSSRLPDSRAEPRSLARRAP